MRRVVKFALSAVLSVAGCASHQLNYNTMDIAQNSDDLLTTQIVHNLGNYITNPIAVPAQINIDSGAASTSYSVNPSVSIPVAPSSALSNAFSAAGAVSGSVTRTRSASTANLSGTNTWNQNYSFQTVTDNERFARLNALYRFAVTGDRSALRDYPPIHKTVTKNRCIGRTGTTDAPQGKAAGKVIHLYSGQCVTGSNYPKIAGGSVEANLSVSPDQSSDSVQVPDEYFLKGPGCAVCKLQPDWLHWRYQNGRPSPAGRAVADSDTYLGTSKGVALYVGRGHSQDYVHFAAAILWALNASSSATAGGAASSSSSSSKGPKLAIATDPETGEQKQLLIPSN